MEHALHRGMAAGVAAAVAVAGLIAVTPITPPDLHVQQIDVQLTNDLFTALSYNVGDISTELGNALTLLTDLQPQLPLSEPAWNLLESAGVALFIPENLITAGLAALTGDNSPNYFESAGAGGAFSPDVLGALGALLQSVMGAVSNGLTSLFALDPTDAFTDFAAAFDSVVAGIPETLVVDSLLALGL